MAADLAPRACGVDGPLPPWPSRLGAGRYWLLALLLLPAAAGGV